MKGSELLRLAQLSAYAAARQLVDRVPDEVRCKGTAMDLVTDRDVEAEEAARATIELHRPEDSILAEEGEEKVGSSDVRWIVDALDGTVNYVAGIEDWAVSVAAEIFGGGGGHRCFCRPRPPARQDLRRPPRLRSVVQRATARPAPA